MPYKSTTSLEAQSSGWHRSRISLAHTAPKPTRSKRKAVELGNKDDRPRKRARIEEDQNEYEMDLDQDLDLDLDESMMEEVEPEEERQIAVDDYGLPLLGFAPTDDSALVGLSSYAIDVDCIVRQGFGDGSDASIGMDMYKRFRPCGAIRDLSLAVRFTISSITASRIIFEDEISVRKALMFDHNQLSYHVGDSLRRLWVRRTSYTSDEWTIIPEYQTASAADQAEQHMPSPLFDYCRAHPSAVSVRRPQSCRCTFTAFHRPKYSPSTLLA